MAGADGTLEGVMAHAGGDRWGGGRELASRPSVFCRWGGVSDGGVHRAAVTGADGGTAVAAAGSHCLQLIERYTRLEFKTWLREVSTDATAAADSLAPAPVPASSGSSAALWHTFCASHAPRLSQTVGWIAVAIRCCSICPPSSSGWPGLRQHRSRR